MVLNLWCFHLSGDNWQCYRDALVGRGQGCWTPDKVQDSSLKQRIIQFKLLAIFSLVTQLCPTLWPHELQHSRPPCPSPTPGVHPNPYPLRRWCHPTISSSVVPFSCPQSFPTSGSFQMSQLFASGGQSIGVSASTSVLPMNIQDWSPLEMDWLDLLAVQETLKSLLQHHTSKAPILWHSAFFIVQLSHPYVTTGKTIALTRQTFVSKVMSLLFNMLSELVIVFLPRSKCLLISWQQSPPAVILEPKIDYYILN